ncbi:MAG: type I DNA topoisomerase [Alphaproteobacteria bacterium]|nr:MAG: type I DNA topoisomerase [Alphaproteobacteria bacterium]TAF13542.1 MAG: type I DNA topoisomerase [Alphaproteobacteria bacterium]TAF40378.1 MAG: type I DNA topoisomerase [Alphaproteobacteria bacterium]TAF77515.1 MAG: type I DNA topoisomerase [Alphaproteobacteria bacterium]
MYTLIVESPSKAKTINKYLGSDFHVLASFGHVRDLPSKDGSVRPDEDFAMDYQVADDSKRHMNEIAQSLKNASILYLATDPDREGEAISWHVVEALREAKKLPKNIEIQRVTFTEITKKAVLDAIAKPRAIDMDLVNAQQARRALDYLVGFGISPILWRKLPGAKSAGRVQSVALRLICERDSEIEQFIQEEYWDISAKLSTKQGSMVLSKLIQWQGEKLEKLTIKNEAQATAMVEALRGKHALVDEVKPRQMRRNPYPPFTTSTLQMDASRKLGMSAKQTMMVAQKLYEGIDLGGETVGLITYMRTDGVQVSQEAIADTRRWIESECGAKYLPNQPRMYSSKAKNAQEAHEAIRPTSVTRTPEKMRAHLTQEQFRLYELIWKRLIASQMEAAVYDQMSITFKELSNPAMVRASGSVLRFDGFLKMYRQGLDDDQSDEEENQILPPLEVGERVEIAEVTPAQHFTEPPPRFTEASLVKRLEELGIGRPSTYASIISVLQDRGYVALDKKRFIAQMRGRLVNSFLEHYFARYVEYDFTANLEQQLDEVSAGTHDWKKVLHEFWHPFFTLLSQMKEIGTREVLEELDRMLTPFIYGKAEVQKEEKICPSCHVGTLHLKTGKFGAFLGCTNYPECRYTKPLDPLGNVEGTNAQPHDTAFPIDLGGHSETNAAMQVKKGPYGAYVEMMEEGAEKPKRASVPKTMNAVELTREQAEALLALPRRIGTHPETNKVITAGLGRFGPYIRHDSVYIGLKEDDVLSIGMNRAVDLIAEAKTKPRGAGAEPLRVLGEHPELGGVIGIYSGKYGAYVKHKIINATLPKDAVVEEVTMEEALALLAKKQPKTAKAKAPAKTKKQAAPKQEPKEKKEKKAPAKAKEKAKAPATKKAKKT